MYSFGIKSDKIEIVPEMISQVEVVPETIRELEEKYKPNNSFIILYVGRLEPEKGLSILIKAFRDLSKEDPSFKLVVVGTGRLARLIEEESKKNQNVIYIGQISHEQIGNYYAISDVVVIPSIVPEGHPLVAEEALLMKKPVIGFDLGSLPEIINTSTKGKLVKEIDSKALANAIFSLRQEFSLKNSNWRDGM
jgi:glycosyltransferase involved in cell wall biosynthesis